MFLYVLCKVVFCGIFKTVRFSFAFILRKSEDMKKAFLVFSFLFALVGCASAPKPAQVSDDSQTYSVNPPDTEEVMKLKGSLSEAQTLYYACQAQLANYSAPKKTDSTCSPFSNRSALAARYTVRFKTGKSAFTPPETMLDSLSLLKTAKRIEIYGRTDSEKDTQADRKVSLARALDAREWLIDKGVPQNIIVLSATSFGDFETTDETKFGDNRRVDILVFK
jgi:outer membrane protein OmpA-like peptidoglycan-associated protein